MVSVFLEIFIAFSSGDALGGIRCGGKTSLETTRNSGNSFLNMSLSGCANGAKHHKVSFLTTSSCLYISETIPRSFRHF